MSATRTDNLLVGVASALMVAVVSLPLAAGAPDFAKAFGWPVTLLLWLLLCAAAIVLDVVFFGYLHAMEGAAAGARSQERLGYLKLRKDVAAGGKGQQLNARWLTALLHRTDQFFGDLGHHSAWQLRVFRLQHAAPLWSAPAYDRCLLLALIYPLGVMFVGWVLSGQVGQAETALAFGPQTSWPKRLLVLVTTVSLLCAMVKFDHAMGWRNRVSWAVAVAGASAVAVAMIVSGAGAGSAVLLVPCATFLAVSSASMGLAGVVGFGGTFALVVASSVSSSFVGAVGLAVAIASAIAVASAIARKTNCATSMLLGTTLLFASATYAGAYLLPWSATHVRPLLLFGVVLTIVNAPFDWLSLGLTRGLLRLGLQLRGAWPSVLAVLDAALAALLVLALAGTAVVAVQAFDLLAIQGGAVAISPLVPLLDALAVAPQDTQHWWMHAMLLSTLLPSLLNLAVGCTSWLRSWPWLMRWVLRQMPLDRQHAGRAVEQRVAVAALLTAQWGLGGLMGLMLMASTVWLVLGSLLPGAGLGLLDLMRLLADYNVPARLACWWLR